MIIVILAGRKGKMRKLKKHEKISLNKKTERIKPYRSFYLTSDEMVRLNDFKNRHGGKIVTNDESEQILKDFLDSRGMGALLYPDLERDDWSGYVKVWDGGLMWLL